MIHEEKNPRNLEEEAREKRDKNLTGEAGAFYFQSPLRSRFLSAGEPQTTVALKLSISNLEALPKSNRVYLSQKVFQEIVEDLQEKYSSQRKAAAALGCYNSFLSRMASGKRLSVRVEILLKILRALGRRKIPAKKVEVPNDYRRRSIAKANAQKRLRDVKFEAVVLENSEKIVIDVLKWLRKCEYVKRLKKISGLVKFLSMNVRTESITIKYEVFKKASSDFEVSNSMLPRFVQLDTDTMYFLGLWCGDNAGGGRAGIVNQNFDILKKNVDLLRTCFGQPVHHLIGDVMSSLELDEADKERYGSLLREINVENVTYTVNKGILGSPVFTVSAHNAVLRRLLDFVKSNLSSVFTDVGLEARGAFYAGLFDAEGNVNFNPDNRQFNFRWSIKDKEFVNWLSEMLQKEGFSPHYDGVNLKVGRRKDRREEEFRRFVELILPHIVHSEKRVKTRKMLNHTL